MAGTPPDPLRIVTGVYIMLCRKVARGFTKTELLFVIFVVGVVVVVAVGILLPTLGRPRVGYARQLKDSSQIRGIVQAMAIWAGNHKGRYPLPSDIDVDDATVPDHGPVKDTTANILSLMVFNGSVPTEMLISPSESNSNIQHCNAYQFNSPASAVVPTRALWDPALSADFTGGRVGHNSYAHLLPSGARLDKWTDDFNARSVVLGNRGPQIISVAKNSDGTITATPSNTKSNTFLIHGGDTTWEGNIGFGDARVDFQTNLSAEVVFGFTYKDDSGALWPDLFHYDEPDDPTGANAFLGIFTKAGAKPTDFNAIWD